MCVCAAPFQQPPPEGFAVNYSSIQLTWHPPDSPNSNTLNYTLIRDGHPVHNIQRHYPFSKYTKTISNGDHLFIHSSTFTNIISLIVSFLSLGPESFEDTGLFPYTSYSYWLVTANMAGATTSKSVLFQTLAAPPEADQLHLNLVGRPSPTSASFNWSLPRNDTGPVER